MPYSPPQTPTQIPNALSPPLGRKLEVCRDLHCLMVYELPTGAGRSVFDFSLIASIRSSILR